MAHCFPCQQRRGQSGEAVAAAALAVQCQGKLCQAAPGISTVVQGFAAAQGVPTVSFLHSSTVSGTYTSENIVALWPPFLAPICAAIAIEGTAATGSVTCVHFTPSTMAMGLPPPRVLDFLSKTQQSVSSVSHLSSQKKRPPPSEPPKANDWNDKRGKIADDDDNSHVDTPSKYDAYEDYISILSTKKNSGVANQSIHEWDAERETIERLEQYSWREPLPF